MNKILDDIVKKIKFMTSKQVLFLNYSVLVRQKTLFDYISKELCWKNSEIVDDFFDKVVLFFDEGKSITYDDTELNSDTMFHMGWECNDEILSGCLGDFFCAISAFYDLYLGLLENEEDYREFIGCNFQFLDIFLYEFGYWDGNNNESFLKNKYVQLELERTYRDIEKILNNTYDYLTNKNEAIIDIELIKEIEGYK